MQLSGLADTRYCCSLTDDAQEQSSSTGGLFMNKWKHPTSPLILVTVKGMVPMGTLSSTGTFPSS